MKKLINSKLLLQVIVASVIATLATAGIVVATTTIGTNITTGGTLEVTGASTLTGNTAVSGTLDVTGATTLSSTLTVDTSTLSVDATNNKVGVGTTTPFATLSINDVAGQNALVIGSSTATYLTVNTTGNLAVDTNTLLVDAVNNRVGIGSTTPTAALSVGGPSTVSTGTSTIDFAKPCFRMTTDDGTTLYYWPSLKAGVLGGWATSTASCF